MEMSHPCWCFVGCFPLPVASRIFKGFGSPESSRVGISSLFAPKGRCHFLWFGKHGSLDRILLQGRWMAAKTARTYLNEGLAVLTSIKVPVASTRPFHLVYSNALRTRLPAWKA